MKRKVRQRIQREAQRARKEAAGDFSHLKNKKGELLRNPMAQPTLPNISLDDDDYDDNNSQFPMNRGGASSKSNYASSMATSTAVTKDDHYYAGGAYPEYPPDLSGAMPEYPPPMPVYDQKEQYAHGGLNTPGHVAGGEYDDSMYDGRARSGVTSPDHHDPYAPPHKHQQRRSEQDARHLDPNYLHAASGDVHHSGAVSPAHSESIYSSNHAYDGAAVGLDYPPIPGNPNGHGQYDYDHDRSPSSAVGFGVGATGGPHRRTRSGQYQPYAGGGGASGGGRDMARGRYPEEDEYQSHAM